MTTTVKTVDNWISYFVLRGQNNQLARKSNSNLIYKNVRTCFILSQVSLQLEVISIEKFHFVISDNKILWDLSLWIWIIAMFINDHPSQCCQVHPIFGTKFYEHTPKIILFGYWSDGCHMASGAYLNRPAKILLFLG